ncbi:MAG TPA: LON peptidase substrate-binding domain-containing protein [Acidimicrobiales bacterium]|nr:LON peptidase substrate-binding domain-containing protein [Acidimicrobiales bacterium]
MAGGRRGIADSVALFFSLHPFSRSPFMPDLDTTILPLLPLSTGAVLPGMVVTMALETEEARVAVEAAASGDGRLLVVPRVDDRYARVGTVSKLEDSGELPSGTRAVVVRGMERAVVGAGVPGTGSALWVQAERVGEHEPSERCFELAREYRAVVQNILEERGARQLAEALRGITDPGAMADTAGYSPDLTLEQKVELLETVDVEARLERVLAWAKDTLADLALKERIRNDVAEGMEKTQREFLLRQQLAAIRK